VKLLFDHNLSSRLTELLAEEFPQSIHVQAVGLERADDAEIWDYARRNGYIIASKDDDFRQRSFLFGHPPKILWLRLGNSTTQQIADALRRSAPAIRSFADDPLTAILVLT